MAGRFPLLRDYEVLAEAGRGTLGTVYKALHRRTHDLRALKKIDTRSAELRARVQASTRAARGLGPAFAAIYEVIEEPTAVYVVSELVDGRDLLAYAEPPVARDPERLKRVFFVLGQVLKALSTLHHKKLVHRGLKPTNVLVTREGRAKVTDVGLAREWHLKSTGTMPVDAGQLAAYYAPEQVLGQEADARSDLYAFGLLLYETLAARKPHAAPSPLLQVQARATQPPLPLAVGAPRLERAFGPLLARLLSLDPEVRPATADEVLSLLKEAWDESGHETGGKEAPAPKPAATHSPGTPGARPATSGARGDSDSGLRTRPFKATLADTMEAPIPVDEARTARLSIAEAAALHRAGAAGDAMGSTRPNPAAELTTSPLGIPAVDAATTARLPLAALRVAEALAAGPVPSPAPDLVPAGGDDAVERLDRGLSAARAGNGVLLALGGDDAAAVAGVARAFASRARSEGATVLSARCSSGPAAAPNALAGLLEDLSERLATLSPADLSGLLDDRVAALFSISPALARLDPQRRAAPADAGPAEIASSLAVLLGRLTAAGPMVLLLEDMESADAFSLAGLQWLTRSLLARPRSHRAPVLPVVTFALGDTPPGHPFLRAMAVLGDEGLADRIDLSGHGPRAAGGGPGSHDAAGAARALAAAGDRTGALRHWRAILERGATGSEAATARAEIPGLLLALGDVAAASAAYREQFAALDAAARPHDALATLAALAEATRRTGDLAAAEAHARAALARARALGALAVEARTLECLGAIARRRLDRSAAAEHLGRALRLHRALHAEDGAARCLSQFGASPFVHDDPVTARARLDEALAIQERIADDPAGRATTLVNLSAWHLRAHDPETALALADRALPIDQLRGDARGVALARLAAARAHLLEGDFRKALEGLEPALASLERAGDVHGAASALALLGETYARTHNVREALRRYADATARLASAPDPLLECAARTGLAGAMHETGDRARALTEAGRAVAIAEAKSARGALVAALLAVARISGSLAEAERALALAQDLGDQALHLRSHHEIALLHLARGENEAARGHLRQAFTLVDALAAARGSGRDAFLRIPEVEAVVRDAKRV